MWWLFSHTGLQSPSWCNQEKKVAPKTNGKPISDDNGVDSAMNEVGTGVTDSKRNIVPEKFNHLYKFFWIVDNVETTKLGVGKLMGEYKNLIHACDTEVGSVYCHFNFMLLLKGQDSIVIGATIWVDWLILHFVFLINFFSYELGLCSACMIRYCFMIKLVWNCLVVTINWTFFIVLCVPFIVHCIYLGKKLLSCIYKGN